MKKGFIWAALITIGIISATVIISRGKVSAPKEEIAETENLMPPSPAPSTRIQENTVTTTRPEISEGEPENSMPEIEIPENTVRFTNKGFLPAVLTINKGDIVTFKNESLLKTWPASAIHPTHTVYPAQGGCIGSTFDACRGLKKGEYWSFVFDEVGTWKYHDHLNPRFTGTIVVQ